MIHPGIAIQQADVDLGAKLRLGLGLATHDGTYMRLMNARDAIFYLMALLLVHCLLLFQQMLDHKKIFQLHPFLIKSSVFMMCLMMITPSTSWASLVGAPRLLLKFL